MRKTLSIALFTIYSLVLSHSFLPHFHIDYNEAAEAHHEHNFDHHAHQHHEHSNSTSWFDGFIDFLNHLGHKDIGENHLDEYIAADHSQFAAKSAQVLNCTEPVVLTFSQDLTIESEKTDCVIRPPILYEHLLSSSEPLRGPPSIA